MPGHSQLLPLVEPLHFGAGFNEKLHLHLFKLTHTEDELTCNDLVSEGFTNLGDTKRQLHTSGLLHIQVVNEDSLGRFGTKIDLIGTISRVVQLRAEHQIELTNVGPVLGSADWVYDFLVYNDLLECFEVRSLHSEGVTLVEGVAFGLDIKHTRIRFTEFGFVKSLTKAFSGFGHLFIDLLIIFGDLIFNEVIGPITLL